MEDGGSVYNRVQMVVKELVLGVSNVKWFIPMLEECSQSKEKEYVRTFPLNSYERYLALVEYGVFERRGFIIIPKKKKRPIAV